MIGTLTAAKLTAAAAMAVAAGLAGGGTAMNLMHAPAIAGSAGAAPRTLAHNASHSITAPARPAAPAAPASDHTCGTGSSGGNVTTCMYNTGEGLHIDLFDAQADVNNVERTLQVCITGALGTRCSGFSPIPPDPPNNVQQELWWVNGNVPAGNYCAITNRKNPDGSVTQIGYECALVHP